MKKSDMAHDIVWAYYKEMPTYHEFRRQGYDNASAKARTEKWFVNHYTKQEIIDMYNQLFGK